MRVGIIGAGFTGLAAAYYLGKNGHSVTVYENSNHVGGLAAGIKKAIGEEELPWEWDLEQYYHHWFTNDDAVFCLGNDLGVSEKFIITRPSTDILYNNQAFAFDSPLNLLRFPYLPLTDKIKTGLLLARLKYLTDLKGSAKFENVLAHEYLRKNSGETAYKLIWEPLLMGKFADSYKEVNMRWFWARIYKRTPKLAYYQGGFGAFAGDLAGAITNQGGQIKLAAVVNKISPNPDETLTITTPSESKIFDKVIVTTPPATLARMIDDLPTEYIAKLENQKGIGALVLILALEHQLMPKTYWLSINNTDWPFLALVEHTNFMPKEKYNNEHIIYVGDYLPKDHPHMQLSKEELIEKFTPYLKRICPFFSEESIIRSFLFKTDYAQPIVGLNHEKNIPPHKTPIKNLYLGCMAQVYPWDRGTNYAIEMGKRIVSLM